MNEASAGVGHSEDSAEGEGGALAAAFLDDLRGDESDEEETEQSDAFG